jgi:hypothetical protein
MHDVEPNLSSSRGQAPPPLQARVTGSIVWERSLSNCIHSSTIVSYCMLRNNQYSCWQIVRCSSLACRDSQYVVSLIYCFDESRFLEHPLVRLNIMIFGTTEAPSTNVPPSKCLPTIPRISFVRSLNPSIPSHLPDQVCSRSTRLRINHNALSNHDNKDNPGIRTQCFVQNHSSVRSVR